jgi:hypothetical protein
MQRYKKTDKKQAEKAFFREEFSTIQKTFTIKGITCNIL